MFEHTLIILHARWNIGPPSKHTHNTRLQKRMENEEIAQLDAQHQKELDSLKNKVAKLASLLE